MLEAIFFATPLWFIVLVVTAIPLIRGPLGLRKRHIVARSCQATMFGLWLGGIGGGLLAGLNTAALSFLGNGILPDTFLRLCQVAPLMALALIGLVAMVMYTYRYPAETPDTLTRESRGA